MRRILVDRARRRMAVRYGGDHQRVELHEFALGALNSPEEILVVHDLFDAFAEAHINEAEAAKLRYFAGFTLEEVAQAKMPDLNAADMDAAVRIIAGTARSMGVDVEGV